MKTLKATFFGLAAVALFLGSASVAPAATIVWDPAATISADTDVSTTGTFLKAFNLGDTTNSPLINGVTFAAGPDKNDTNTLTIGTGEGSLTMTANGPANTRISGGTPFTANASPFKDLSANYKTLLKGANYAYPAGDLTGTATINSLTIGQIYLVQFWVNDPRGDGIGRTETFTAGNAVTMDYNSTDADGGVGQFVTGTFTADGATQEITTLASASYQINGYQIRTIPEPSTVAFLLVGLGTFLGVRRRSARTLLG